MTKVFEALWAPRWFGQDQAVAVGCEAPYQFRGPVTGPVVLMAAGLDRPRQSTHCRVLGLKHDELGRLQAIEIVDGFYRFVRHSGEVVEVDAQSARVRVGLDRPPVDWVVRVVFEVL